MATSACLDDAKGTKQEVTVRDNNPDIWERYWSWASLILCFFFWFSCCIVEAQRANKKSWDPVNSTALVHTEGWHFRNNNRSQSSVEIYQKATWSSLKVLLLRSVYSDSDVAQCINYTAAGDSGVQTGGQCLLPRMDATLNINLFMYTSCRAFWLYKSSRCSVICFDLKLT